MSTNKPRNEVKHGATQSRHTPGPWLVTNSVASTDLKRIETRAGEEIGAVHRENANLIAAAPELLAACKLLLDELPLSDDRPEVYEALVAIESAVAKAEGVTNVPGSGK